MQNTFLDHTVLIHKVPTHIQHIFNTIVPVLMPVKLMLKSYAPHFWFKADLN